MKDTLALRSHIYIIIGYHDENRNILFISENIQQEINISS